MITFVVRIEEGVVLPNWAAGLGSPLIENIERRGLPDFVTEELVGIQCASIPVVKDVSMKLV